MRAKKNFTRSFTSSLLDSSCKNTYCVCGSSKLPTKAYIFDVLNQDKPEKINDPGGGNKEKQNKQMNSPFDRKSVKLDSRERASEFKRLYEITTIVGVGGGGTVYAGKRNRYTSGDVLMTSHVSYQGPAPGSQ